VAEVDQGEVRRTLLTRIIGASEPWRWHAACIGEPIEVFFPPLGGSSTRARAICAGCPVREPCLDEALADETLDHGLRAGLTAPERKRMRKGRTT
jgi:WhiB family redox-sensing transcriptional regulator